MPRVVKCIDNGPMEGFFGTLKAEMFYQNRFKNYEKLQTKLENSAPMVYRNRALNQGHL